VIDRLSGVTREAGSGTRKEAFFVDVLICARIAERSSEDGLAGGDEEPCGFDDRYDVSRTGSLDGRELGRRRLDAMEAGYKRFRILAMFCS
jgi:hypothetical protein